MTDLPAARVGDAIAHSNAGTGMLLGVLAGVAVGAVLVAATVATGGLALVAAAGAAAGAVSAGGLGGMYIGEASMGPACGTFVTGSPNVFVNSKPATFTAGSFASCSKDSGPIPLATGSASVIINSGYAGRRDETLGCSAKSVPTVSPNVFIGGPSAQDPRVSIQPEVPGWAVTALQVLGVAGAIAALPFAIATVGVAATIGGGLLGFAGALGGGAGGRALGEALGLSEAGTSALETAGGFLGGMVGGAAGVRGGQAASARYQAAVVASRRATAQSFYAEQNWPQARIDSHLKGIDFSKPVRVGSIPANSTMGQWQVPNGPKGNYFAPVSETPGRLGISPVGHDPAVGAVSKVQTTYTNPGPVRALQSHAANIDDNWSSPYATAVTPGGGTQYFVPDPGSFH